MTTPSNADLREAITEIIVSIIQLPRGKTVSEDYYTDEIMQLFQAREQHCNAEPDDQPNDVHMKFFNLGHRAGQQQLLTELLGQLPEKPKKDDIAKIMTTGYTGDNMARAYSLAISEVVSVIAKYREGL